MSQTEGNFELDWHCLTLTVVGDDETYFGIGTVRAKGSNAFVDFFNDEGICVLCFFEQFNKDVVKKGIH